MSLTVNYKPAASVSAGLEATQDFAGPPHCKEDFSKVVPSLDFNEVV